MSYLEVFTITCPINCNLVLFCDIFVYVSLHLKTVFLVMSFLSTYTINLYFVQLLDLFAKNYLALHFHGNMYDLAPCPVIIFVVFRVDVHGYVPFIVVII